MTNTLKLALLCLTASTVRAQSVPAGVGSVPNVGFQLPQLSGRFNYSLNVSELISSGFYGGGTQYSTNLSGNASYLSSNTKHPFSTIYSGGVLLANSGQPTTVYQSLSLAQGYVTQKWNFQIADTVSYLPESPVTGLSGVPGVGDLGINPLPQGPEAGIGILTTYGPRVSNTITGSAGRILSAHLSAQASAYNNIQRFVGANSTYGVDNTSEGGTGGVNYRFNTRNTLFLNYNYTNFSYGGDVSSFSTQSGTVGYSRQWTRRLATSVYAGPQYVAYGNPALGGPSTQLTAGASASYAGRSAFYTLAYSRGTTNGSGVIGGSFANSVIGAAHRQFGRTWALSGSLGYTRSSSLPSLNLATFSSDSVAAGAQASRSLGRRFVGYASYTVQEQSTAGFVPLYNTYNVANGSNAFSGVTQTFGIGVSYSPGSMFFNR